MSGNYTSNRTHSDSMHAWTFLGVFLAVFFFTSILLFAIDFVPESGKQNNLPEESKTQTATSMVVQNYQAEEPVRIMIAAIGVNTPVENPVTTDSDILDNALLKGAARYPGSGILGENARMFIFGHQSYLPVVHNKAFQAFNGLQNLKGGEDIVIFSATAAYHYRVTSVAHESADTALVELGDGARTLTLSTCDSFGKKTDRNVVTAEFISREALTKTNS